MKKIIFILISVILFGNILAAQNERVYEQFSFEGYEPLWKHTVIDTSIIGVLKQISFDGDSIFFDGFSSFWGIEIYKVDPVIYDGKIVISELLNGPMAEGAFVQCLDLITGKEIWNTYFDRRTDQRKEYYRDAYINDKGQYELLGLRQNLKIPGNNQGRSWHHGLMTIRRYNLETGELEERILTDENGPDARQMRVPFNFGIRELYTHLFRKGSNYQYIEGYPYIFSYVVDELSHTIDSSEYRHNYSFQQYFRNETYRCGENKIVNLMYLSDIFNFDMKDTFELRYNLFNRELELLESMDLTGLMQPSLKHLTMYVDEGSFIILSGDTIRHEGRLMDQMTFSLFDIQGNLKEVVTLKDENGVPYKIDYFWASALKLRNEPGMLIMVELTDDEGNNYLGMFKTDGSGNFEMVKNLKILGSGHGLFPIVMYHSDKDDIILKGLHKNLKLYDANYRGFATVYILFSGEDLGLQGSSTQQLSEIPNIHIHPNPATHSITISHGYEGEARIEVMDVMGRVVVGKMAMSAGEDELDVSVLNAGVYVVRVLDRRGVVVGRGKFIRR